MIARFSAVLGMLMLLVAENANARPFSNPTWDVVTPSVSSFTIGTSTIDYTQPTSPISDIWYYNGNINNQSQDNLKSVFSTALGIQFPATGSDGTTCDNSCTGTFSSSTSFNLLAVHFGNGELLFQFQNPIKTFTFDSADLPNGLSNYRSYTDVPREVSPVPEPTEGALLLAGLALLGFIAARRKSV